jgi:hypothetical protein
MNVAISIFILYFLITQAQPKLYAPVRNESEEEEEEEKRSPKQKVALNDLMSVIAPAYGLSISAKSMLLLTFFY